MIDPLNRLCKWRMVLAGWHHGTRSIEQPGIQAMRDLMDKWLIMRAEGSALVALLVGKGVFTAAEFAAAVQSEAARLDRDLEQVFPGFRTTDDGVQITDMALATATMLRLGFPP
jgi:hypothetical protein